MQISLLLQLLDIHSPSGNELAMSAFIKEYFSSRSFKTRPKVYAGEMFQDCIAVVFGTPRTAVFAHMDTVGFTVRYGSELVEIGSPDASTSDSLTGKDSKGEIACSLITEQEALSYHYEREIDRGTELVYAGHFEEKDGYITSPYLDDRVGLWNALSLADELENGMLVFTAWEEHKGGTAGMMGKFMYEEHGIRQALISDMTYTTQGIFHGSGAVVSMRDSGIPRRAYVNKVLSLAESSGIPYQIEVESFGGSDGNELQKLPYPIDWCFVGAPCSNMHSSREQAYLKDIEAMHELYKVLLGEL